MHLKIVVNLSDVKSIYQQLPSQDIKVDRFAQNRPFNLLLHAFLNKECINKLKLASSGPYGPLLARSGYPGQHASFYNNPIVMIDASVNALTVL